MNLDMLKESLLSVDESIADDLATRITHPYASCKNFGRRLHGLVSMYRTRGILRYLIDAEVGAFFADLNREALTFQTFFEAHHAKLDIPAERIHGGNWSPLACAVAAGNFPLAANLDRLMPRTPGKREDMERFGFTSMLRALAARPQDQKDALDTFEEHCEEMPQIKHLIGAARGLIEMKPKAFANGLRAYLDSFSNLDEAALEELDPGEDVVSIEGLAFLQIAKARGLDVKLEHDRTPRDLRTPRGKVPTDGYPPWPG